MGIFADIELAVTGFRADPDMEHQELAVMREYDYQHKLRWLLPLMELNETDNVLDIGCGHAALLGVIHDRIRAYHGIDLEQKFIDGAHHRFRKILLSTFERVSIDSPIKQKYDTVFMMDVSEHLKDGDLMTSLATARTALKDGGRLYLHTPNGNYFWELWKRTPFWPQIAGHIAVRGPEELSLMVELTGFTVKTNLLSHYVAPFKWLHALSYIPIVGKYFSARIFIEAIR